MSEGEDAAAVELRAAAAAEQQRRTDARLRKRFGGDAACGTCSSNLWPWTVCVSLLFVGVTVALLVVSVAAFSVGADSDECVWSESVDGRAILGLCVWAIVIGVCFLTSATINLSCAVCNRSRWHAFQSAAADAKPLFLEMWAAKRVQQLISCFGIPWMIVGCVALAQVDDSCRAEFASVWWLSLSVIVLPWLTAAGLLLAVLAACFCRNH
jgi:hypothetical protein